VSTDETTPFEIRSANWYREPLDYTLVLYEANHDTHVATITMNRPEKAQEQAILARAESKSSQPE